MNRWIFLFSMIFVLGSATQACAKEYTIVCTIGQITDLVKKVAGDHAHIIGLMGAGVDPHLYKASESDVRTLSKADIIFYNGLHLEAKMAKVFKRMKRYTTVVAIGDELNPDQLLNSEQYAGQHDPHIWFDVSLWQEGLKTITETLIAFDPEHTLDYQKSYLRTMEELTMLDAYVFKRAEQVEKNQRVLVTAHDAFRYFGRRYHFKVLGLQGMSTESEAGTNDVMRLVDYIVEHKIPAIFVESSVSERNIRAVKEAAEARGWNVQVGGELYSDAVGEDGSYIHMVVHNIDTIVRSLNPKADQHSFSLTRDQENKKEDEYEFNNK